MDVTQKLSWAAIVEVGICESLPGSAKAFAVDELRRLAEYLDDQIFFDRCGEMHVEPFYVGKPSPGWGSELLQEGAA